MKQQVASRRQFYNIDLADLLFNKNERWLAIVDLENKVVFKLFVRVEILVWINHLCN